MEDATFGPPEPRGTVVRRVTHEPFGGRPTVLKAGGRRYRCVRCSHAWRRTPLRRRPVGEAVANGGAP